MKDFLAVYTATQNDNVTNNGSLDEQLSLIKSGANTEQNKQIQAMLFGNGTQAGGVIDKNRVLLGGKPDMVKRKIPLQRRNKHLCADPGYRGKPTMKDILDHGYIAHVVDRRREVDIKRRDPKKKARRWVVEVSHSWFNRFRKLLVRYEKLERSFLAPNYLAATIIAFRKVDLRVNMIYG